MEEIWKDIVIDGLWDNVKYQVSNMGKVRSIRERNPITSASNGHSYMQFNINNKATLINIGHLVLLAFGDSTPKSGIKHKNGNKQDNSIGNIEYKAHKRRANTWSKGNKVRSKKKDNGFPLGVYKPRNSKKYIAQIRTNHITIILGSYSTPKEAGIAYEIGRKFINSKDYTSKKEVQSHINKWRESNGLSHIRVMPTKKKDPLLNQFEQEKREFFNNTKKEK